MPPWASRHIGGLSQGLARSRGHTCRTLRGTGSVSTRLVGWFLTWLLGSNSSICPVGSRALRIREELTQPGSTSRTQVRYIWRPHSNDVVAAAVILLYSGSIGLKTRCPLLRCACQFMRTACIRNLRRHCPIFVDRPRPPEGGREG